MWSRHSNKRKKVEITISAIVEVNVKSGTYFDQTLTAVLTMKIYSAFDHIEFIIT